MHLNNETKQKRDKDYINFLKENTNIVDLFEYLGLFDDGTLHVRGHRIVGVCPMPDHPDADNPTAFNFDIEKKLFYCHTKCNQGGDLIRFLERYLDLTFSQVIDFLETFLGIEGEEGFKQWQKIHRERSRTSSRAKKGISPPETLPLYQFIDRYPPAPDWAKQLVGEDVADYFDLRYTAKGYYRHRLLWPIHDHRGRPVGMTGRTVMPVTKYNPKWLHTPSLRKQHILFNLHRALEYIPNDDGTVFLVEGPKDVAALWRFGQPNVVAVLGYTLSEHQIWLLREYAKNVVILLDNEPSAVFSAAKMAKKLRSSRKLSVWVMPLPKGKDPWDIDEATFFRFKKKIVPARHFLRFFDEHDLN